MSSQTTVLEEEYDPDYEPTEEEIHEYAEFLGMDLADPVCQKLLWIAREGLKAPLPRSWKPCKTKDTGTLYYFNFENGESIWDHPCDKIYKELYIKKRQELEKSVSKKMSPIQEDEIDRLVFHSDSDSSLGNPSFDDDSDPEEKPSETESKTSLKALGKWIHGISSPKKSSKESYTSPLGKHSKNKSAPAKEKRKELKNSEQKEFEKSTQDLEEKKENMEQKFAKFEETIHAKQKEEEEKLQSLRLRIEMLGKEEKKLSKKQSGVSKLLEEKCNEKMEKEEASHLEKLKNTRLKFEKELELLRAELDNKKKSAIQMSKRSCELQIDELRAHFECEKTRFQQAHNDLLVKLHTERKEELDQIREGCGKEMEKVRAAHRLELEALNSQHTEALSGLRQDQQHELEVLQSQKKIENKDFLCELTKSQQNEFQLFKDKIEYAKKDVIMKAKEEQLIQLNEVKSSTNAKILEIQSSHDVRVTSFKKTIE